MRGALFEELGWVRTQVTAQQRALGLDRCVGELVADLGSSKLANVPDAWRVGFADYVKRWSSFRERAEPTAQWERHFRGYVTAYDRFFAEIEPLRDQSVKWQARPAPAWLKEASEELSREWSELQDGKPDAKPAPDASKPPSKPNAPAAASGASWAPLALVAAGVGVVVLVSGRRTR